MGSGIGLAVFLVGMVGMVVGSRGQRGWDRWSRQQKIVCTISFLLVLVGLFLSDL